jgi:hypothetical protein
MNNWWRSDIHEGPDELGFSPADKPYLTQSVPFGGRFATNYQPPAPLQVQGNLK